MVVGEAMLGGSVSSLFDLAVNGFVLLEIDGQIVGCNRAIEPAFGWPRAHLVGSNLAGKLIAEDQRDSFRAAVGRLVASAGDPARGEKVEVRMVRQDGAEVPVRLGLWLVDAGDRLLVAGAVHDASAPAETLARLQRLEAVIASSGEAIISGGLDGRIETWNPAAERLFGYHAQEMIRGVGAAAFAGRQLCRLRWRASRHDAWRVTGG